MKDKKIEMKMHELKTTGKDQNAEQSKMISINVISLYGGSVIDLRWLTFKLAGP
jgi:hypothetical protein